MHIILLEVLLKPGSSYCRLSCCRFTSGTYEDLGLARPDLNRLQKTITTACEKERYVRPRERALTTHAKQILNVRTRESSKPVLLAKNRREKNPQLPAKQGRAVTSPSPGIRTYHYHLQKPERSRFHGGST
jgi:hypothetical protein